MMNPFEAPIPGESLTSTPKNAPYENPPEITDPAEAIERHLDNLSNPDTMEAVLELLESDSFTISEIVDGVTRVAVAYGVHSIDVGLLAKPIMHEFIKQTADVLGVEYKTGFENLSRSEQDRKEMAAAIARRKINKMGVETPDVAEEDIDEVPEGMEQEVQEQTTRGLMSRETK